MRTHRNNSAENPEQKKKHQLNNDRPNLRQPRMGVSNQPHVTIKLGFGWYRHLVWVPTSRHALKEVSKVVNLDWISNQAYSLSQIIYVVTNLFITKDYLLEMIRNIIFTNCFF